MAESTWLIIKQRSPQPSQPQFSVVEVTPSGCSTVYQENTDNFTYATRTVHSNTVNWPFVIKMEFAKSCSRGTILDDFKTHDKATQALQKLQLDFIGGERGDTPKVIDHLKMPFAQDENWYFQIIEVALPVDTFPRKAKTGDDTADRTFVMEERSMTME